MHYADGIQDVSINKNKYGLKKILLFNIFENIFNWIDWLIKRNLTIKNIYSESAQLGMK